MLFKPVNNAIIKAVDAKDQALLQRQNKTIYSGKEKFSNAGNLITARLSKPLKKHYQERNTKKESRKEAARFISTHCALHKILTVKGFSH